MKAKRKMHITPSHTSLCQDTLFCEGKWNHSISVVLSWYALLSDTKSTCTLKGVCQRLQEIETSHSGSITICVTSAARSRTSQSLFANNCQCDWLWCLICCFPCTQRRDCGQICSHRRRNHEGPSKKVLSPLSSHLQLHRCETASAK